MLIEVRFDNVFKVSCFVDIFKLKIVIFLLLLSVVKIMFIIKLVLFIDGFVFIMIKFFLLKLFV